MTIQLQQVDMKQARYIDERLEPASALGMAIAEHLHRYAVAAMLVKGKIVLDIAAGEGYGSFMLSESAQRVIGVDISNEAVQKATQRYQRENLAFIEGNTSAIPVESSSIDVVVSFETLEHHDKHEEMMVEIKRVLKKDGYFIVSTPNKRVYTDMARYNNPFHVKELYLEELDKLLKKYFGIVEVYEQKLVCGSLITKLQGEDAKEFEEYEGSFGAVIRNVGLQNAAFFLCIAADTQIPSIPISYFNDFNRIFLELRETYENSWSYRIGRFVLWPVRIIKSILAN